MQYFRVISLTVVFFLISSFSVITPSTSEVTEVSPPYISYSSQWVDSVMQSLSLEEKVAQLLMVAAYSNRGDEHEKELSKIIEQYNIGGLIFFQGGPSRQVHLLNKYQAIAKTPLLIAMDAEWGPSMRLDSTIRYPREMMLGAIQDNRLIYDYGRDVAKQLTRLGVHVNFAPVVDVNNNPNNPVINSRSFGEDKVNVAYKGIAYAIGMQDNGVIAVAKHFPGHGDTDTDSHKALPIIGHSWERIDSLELYPFKELISKGVGGMMIAHLFIPSLDSAHNRASTLSPAIINGLLKDSLGYQGLTFTDALNMKGVSQYYKPGEVEVLAFKAGNDMLLMPDDVPKAVKAILQEVKNGGILEEEINARCRKILLAKQWVGLDVVKPIEEEHIAEDLNTPVYDLLYRDLIQSSLTVVKNESNLLPVLRTDTLKVAAVCIGGAPGNVFEESLSRYGEISVFNVSKIASQDEYTALEKKLQEFDLVIISLQNNSMYPHKNFGITANAICFVDNVARAKTSILCSFANPYALAYFEALDEHQAIAIGYEDLPLAWDYMAQMVFGAIDASGRLPVGINGKYPVGTGVDVKRKNKLVYGSPEQANINRNLLYKIDSIVNEGLIEEAFPGCQVLAARNGVVFYNKSFGYHTYKNKRPVENTDLYDLASLTKILATMPSLMKLYEEGKFDPDEKLSMYYPVLDTTNKKDILVRDVLTHQAGLAPWIPFYVLTIEPMHRNHDLFARHYDMAYPLKMGGSVYVNRNINYRDGAVSGTPSEKYSIKLGDGVYLNNTYVDTVFQRILATDLAPKKAYKYSDLGFYMFAEVIKDLTGKPIDAYVDSMFFGPLGANTLGYLPLNRFEKDVLIPTENDLIFRRQLVQGYVHDPGCAMLGGVCGHAGLFANANDVAKIMQMYLNGGEYGGQQFFLPETIELFTSCPNCKPGKKGHNRRGLGFDKPEFDSKLIGPTCGCVSESSYGHSGFTGTYTWVDPELNLVYVFLSNRIHPDQENAKILKMNLRTDIQKVFVESCIKK